MRPSSFVPALVASLALTAYRSDPVVAEIASACENPTARVCGASDLPRVTNREWREADVQRFVERAAKGTVAVAIDGKAVKLVPECHLPGSYTELRTRAGQGRLWATNRPLLLTSEVEGAACVEATHAVAAFARASSGSPAFSGVLVPLPCPPVADDAPARGCVGRGLTGPLRQARAESLRERVNATAAEKVGLKEFLEAYVLAPDDALALGFLSLARVNSECALYSHAHWVSSQYARSRTVAGKLVATLRPADADERTIDRPTLDFALGDRSCIFHPVFRKCFAGIAEPVDQPRRCWEPAPPTAAQPPPLPAPTRPPTPPTPAKPAAAVTRP
jgi:hypothetical protein